MEQFLEQLEASLGVPAALLERAAEARAGAGGGSSTENVVRAWAGAEEVAGGESPPPAAAAEPAPAEPAVAAEPAAADESAESGLAVEVLEATEPLPEPAEEAEAPAEEPAGVLAGFPGWLAAALLVVPVLALLYVLIAPNGPGCGASGQLAIDAESGLAENCDGTEYGVDVVSFFSLGEEIYFGSAGRCAGCHGDGGAGGSGPAMAGGAVLVTFPGGQCSDHLQWVRGGSEGWPEATYGATNKPVGGFGGNMPAFPDLSDEDLAAVVIYERVAFGGQSVADAEADCGANELELAAGG